MSCVASEYAMLRKTLRDWQSAAPEGFDPLTERVAAALEFLPPLAESNLMTADQIPQCAVVWGEGKYASGVYIGGGSVLTARHLLLAFQTTNISCTIADAATRFGNKSNVCCFIPVPDALAFDMMVLKVTPATDPGLASIPLVTTAEFNVLSAAGANVTLVGFGCGWPVDHPEQAATGLKRNIIVPIDPGAATGIPGFNPALQFVVGRTGGSAPYSTVCTSDSGGAVFAYVGPTLKLIGIIQSSGDPVGSTPDGCGLSRYAVASRVDVGSGWILGAACPPGTLC